MRTNRIEPKITMLRSVWWAAEQRAKNDDVTISMYLTWLITRDTMTIGRRGIENPLHKINNTLRALLNDNTLTPADEREALRTLELVEEIMRRIGDEDTKACLCLTEQLPHDPETDE